jgi:ferrous iron transport protein A
LTDLSFSVILIIALLIKVINKIVKVGVEAMEKTLKQIKPGEKTRVVRLAGEGPVRRRLMDMGVTRGVEIYIRKVAPLGDPIEVNVRGYELTFRKSEAENIIVA